jgi:hypothetical protein
VWYLKQKKDVYEIHKYTVSSYAHGNQQQEILRLGVKLRNINKKLEDLEANTIVATMRKQKDDLGLLLEKRNSRKAP